MKYRFLSISSAFITICNASSEPNLPPRTDNEVWLDHCANISLSSQSNTSDCDERSQSGINKNDGGNQLLQAGSSKGLVPTESPMGTHDKQKKLTITQQANAAGQLTNRTIVETQSGLIFYEGLNGLFSPINKRNSTSPFSENNLFSNLYRQERKFKYYPYDIDEKFLTQHDQMERNSKITCSPDAHLVYIDKIPCGLPQVVLERVLQKIIGNHYIDAMHTKSSLARVGLVAIKPKKHLDDILCLNKRIIWDLYGVWLADAPVERIKNNRMNSSIGNYGLSLFSMIIKDGNSDENKALMSAQNNKVCQSRTLEKAKELQQLSVPLQTESVYAPPRIMARTQSGLIFYEGSNGQLSPIAPKHPLSFFSQHNFFHPDSQGSKFTYYPYDIDEAFLTQHDQMEHNPKNTCSPGSYLVFIDQIPYGLPQVILERVLTKIMGYNCIEDMRTKSSFASFGLVAIKPKKHLDDILCLNKRIIWDLYGVWLADAPVERIKNKHTNSSISNYSLSLRPMIIKDGNTNNNRVLMLAQSNRGCRRRTLEKTKGLQQLSAPLQTESVCAPPRATSAFSLNLAAKPFVPFNSTSPGTGNMPQS